MQTKQKQHLKAKAHSLKPVVIIGNNGLTEAVVKEIDRALHDHELIKVKIAGNDRDARKVMASTICDTLNAELVQAIGTIVTLYRKTED